MLEAGPTYLLLMPSTGLTRCAAQKAVGYGVCYENTTQKGKPPGTMAPGAGELSHAAESLLAGRSKKARKGGSVLLESTIRVVQHLRARATAEQRLPITFTPASLAKSIDTPLRQIYDVLHMILTLEARPCAPGRPTARVVVIVRATLPDKSTHCRRAPCAVEERNGRS